MRWTRARRRSASWRLSRTTLPISNLGILFYNTLFDENASCHIALGLGFPNVIKDYDKYTLDEIHDKGVNDSVIHVDFMVGDATMNIDGITPDGEVIPVFRNGNWTEKFM
ncbi:aminopeptidase [Hominenteromicrobium sp.]|uniref:aminopeptidase n=1 Tax=Hominenteromicrobium sp. TaxID=3073581 RepID=UPI00399BB932